MSDASPARSQRWRSRPWFWVALLVAVVLTICFYTPRRLHGSPTVRWNLRSWHFGPFETRQPFPFAPVSSSTRPFQTMIIVTEGFHFGPLQVFTSRQQFDPQPLGTNVLCLGDRLYDPVTKRELWRVLAVEKQHEFDDDTIKAGVLVRSSFNGGEEWVPREKMANVLVGR